MADDHMDPQMKNNGRMGRVVPELCKAATRNTPLHGTGFGKAKKDGIHCVWLRRSVCASDYWINQPEKAALKSCL